MPIDPSYYRDIIMDNYSYPQNKELKADDGEYDHRHMASDSCIDDITVQAKIKDGIVEDVRFDGQACTISTASTSILTQLVKDKTVEEAEKIVQNYFNMVHGQPYDPELVDEAIVFEGVAKQPNRIGCATIGWKALEEILQASREKETGKEQEA